MLLSKSAIETWQRCRKEYKFRYIDERESRGDHSTWEQRLGLAGHSWLEAYYKAPVGESFSWESPLKGMEHERLSRICKAYAAVWGSDGLRPTEVEVPFEVSPVRGILDGLTVTPTKTYIWEHKFTTTDVLNNPWYWEKLAHDWQVGLYQRAIRARTGGDISVVYNVIRVPMIRQRKNESEPEFLDRFSETLESEPEKYFFRKHVSWSEEELDYLEQDLAAVVGEISAATGFAGSRGNCFAFRRRCEYYGVCFSGESISDASLYQIRQKRGI